MGPVMPGTWDASSLLKQNAFRLIWLQLNIDTQKISFLNSSEDGRGWGWVGGHFLRYVVGLIKNKLLYECGGWGGI